MQKITCNFVLYTLYFLLAPLFTFTAHSTPNAPLHFDGWVTEALAALETNGITGGYHRHTAPLSRADIAYIIQQADARIHAGTIAPSDIDRKRLEKLKRAFHAELAHHTGHAVAFLPQLRATDKKIAPALEGAFHYTRPHLTLYAELETHNFDTPTPTGTSAEQRLERWRGGYTFDFKRGYLQIGSAHLNLLVGRDWLFWGASPHKTLGISDNSPPFDMVRLTGTFGKIKATAFTAQLDATWYDDSKTRYLAKRYLSGHRLEYHPTDWLNIGAAEWILYGGDAQTLEWTYANPITFYYALQYNAKADDNVMFALDAAIRPIDGLRLYGEWLIDDLQYQSDSNDPHAVAWLCGLTWYPKHLKRHLGLHTEYARVNRWAYTHLVPENQFTHFGHTIGHPISTDADTLRLSLSYQFTVSATATVGATVTRHGEGTLADRFHGEDYEALPFPTGVVARTTEISGQFAYRPLDAWNATLTTTWHHTRNAEHRPGETHTGHRFTCHIGYLF